MTFDAKKASIAPAREDPSHDRRGGMNGPYHYSEAERLLDEATSRGESDPAARWCLELGKLHAALAGVAATALTRDGREWLEVAGRGLGNTTPAFPAQTRARNAPGPPRPGSSLSML
jgi:hypothetical protein